MCSSSRRPSRAIGVTHQGPFGARLEARRSAEQQALVAYHFYALAVEGGHAPGRRRGGPRCDPPGHHRARCSRSSTGLRVPARDSRAVCRCAQTRRISAGTGRSSKRLTMPPRSWPPFATQAEAPLRRTPPRHGTFRQPTPMPRIVSETRRARARSRQVSRANQLHPSPSSGFVARTMDDADGLEHATTSPDGHDPLRRRRARRLRGGGPLVHLR